MLQDYTGSVFVPAFWSLGAEEKFYLLAPLFVFVLARARGPAWQASGLRGALAVPGDVRAGDCGQPDRRRRLTPRTFPQYRSPFHLTCESLVLGFAIAWLSLQPWSPRISRPMREALFWAGAAGVLYWLVPSVILGRIDARTIVLAPALIGLCFGAMVLAAVSGSGSYSTVLRLEDVATVGDRLVHAVPHAHDGAARGRVLAAMPLAPAPHSRRDGSRLCRGISACPRSRPLRCTGWLNDPCSNGGIAISGRSNRSGRSDRSSRSRSFEAFEPFNDPNDRTIRTTRTSRTIRTFSASGPDGLRGDRDDLHACRGDPRGGRECLPAGPAARRRASRRERLRAGPECPRV